MLINEISLVLVIFSSIVTLNPAAPMKADARRGAHFFQSQGCVNCHSIKGAGQGNAPDLGRRLDRNYTPAGIAARMWSHAPVMWEAMSKQNIAIPVITPDQASDLFAYFYAARYFEKLGEAERGKRLFDEKRCQDCHALTAAEGGIGPAVENWKSLSAPITLIQRMWNHQTQMHNAMAANSVPWPQLGRQDLDDMLVYLQNLPGTPKIEQTLVLSPTGGGETLFREKGCVECHTGAFSLENRLGDSTLTDVAVAMWNHAPQMRQPPPQLSVDEWQQLISYIWAKQFFGTRGDTVRGLRTFETKKCGTCHENPSSGAPGLSKPHEPYSAITMVCVLWKHGPAMLRRMRDKHITWPQLTENEMANLIAYLNSR